MPNHFTIGDALGIAAASLAIAAICIAPWVEDWIRAWRKP